MSPGQSNLLVVVDVVLNGGDDDDDAAAEVREVDGDASQTRVPAALPYVLLPRTQRGRLR